MFNGTNATGIIFLSLSLTVGAVLASDVLKYGATFESAAGGKTNDFAYAVGDWIGNVFPPPIHPYYSHHANVGTYRGESNGESYGWFAGCEDDESEIIARTDAAGGQALRLNTDLGTLTNKFQQTVANELTTAITNGGGAYIEVEAKFVPSDVCDVGVWDGIGGYRRATSALKLKDIGGYDPIRPPSTFVPASSTSPLFAIYAFCEDNDEHNPTNLVVFHGVMDENGGITYTNEVFPSVTIDTESYTKLRVEMRQLGDPLNPESKYNAFSVRVDDGAPLSSVTALDARFGGTATGTWFMTVEDRSLAPGNLLSSLNFKGCGEIDDIKVGVTEGGSPFPYDPVPEEPEEPAPDSGLDYNRCHDGAEYNATDAPCGWQQVSGSNYVAQAPNGWTWKANGVGLGTTPRNTGGAIDETIGMAFPTLYFKNLPISAEPYVRSPKLAGGVGTIDFRSILLGTTIRTSELTLQVAYTDDEPAEADWIDVAVYRYGTLNGNVFPRINHVVLNDYGVTYVRILRTGYNIYSPNDLSSGRLAVDNICITKPAADVGIIEKLRNPGYPATDQSILMRCAVTNCVESAPATNRHVSVKYQYVARDTRQPVADAAAWSSAEMAYKGKDGNGLDWYEGAIPAQPVGYVWYYYQVDYDGYNYGVNPLTGVSESLSPAYWDAGTDTHSRPMAGARFQVRPYRSRYGRVSFVAEPAAASVGEMTLVGDEQWQTVVSVDGVGAVSSHFVGYGYYEEDAAEFETMPVTWGENNQGGISAPPVAGFLESSHDTVVTNGLVVRNVENYAGFYMYRFRSNDKDEAAAQSPDGDRRYDYIVKKAFYQDFDDWTASADYYESSLGGLPTLAYAENFDGNTDAAQSEAVCVTTAWTEDEYDDDDIKREDFQDEDLSDEFNYDDVRTPNGFIRTESRIIADRKPKYNDPSFNQTIELRPHGKIQNTSDAMPDGLEKVTFKARASVNDRNFALYKGGTDWNETNGKFPLYISATWQLTELSPAKPYFSYIFLYQPPLWDGASWYELRIVQTDSYNANNDSVVVELWRHSPEGAESRIGLRERLTGINLRTSRTVNILVDKNGTRLRVRVHLYGYASYGGNPAEISSGNYSSGAYFEDSSPINLNVGGTIGFGVSDAVPVITAIKVGTTYGGTDLLPSLSATYTDWYAGGKRPDCQPRWTITSSMITRPVPPQTIGIYAVDCVGGASRADVFPLTPVATCSVNSFNMTDFTVDFKAWNKKFVQIRHDDGEGYVVLDEIKCHPWRAMTRSDATDAETIDGVRCRDWTSVAQQDEWLARALDAGDSMSNHWAVLEGWVSDSGPFRNGANFERSRANTNLVQGIVSPLLENGIGSISFSYAASGGKVVYGVERTDEGDGHAWTPVAVFMNAAGDTGERYAGIGEYFGGRIRVRIYGAQDVGGLLAKNPDCGYDPAWGHTDGNTGLLIDNLRAKDYPQDVKDTAWRAYNLRITDNAAYTDQGFIYNNGGKSCFFNNSPADGVYGVEEFNDDDPYLESPPLRDVGIGEIAFQYRLVPGAAGNPDGQLVIKAAPSRDTPLADWTTITNLSVSAAGTAFVKFDDENISSGTNFVVRFYNSREPGTPRIVIDNVLIAAPNGGGNATISLCDPDGNAITDADVLAWIARFGAEQSDIDALTTDKFNEDFLLNLDITKECAAELKITSIQIADDTVTLEVQLTRMEDGAAVGTRAINGRVKLLGGANLADGAFTELVTATIGDDDFGSGDATGVEYELPQQNRPVFFKAVIVDPE